MPDKLDAFMDTMTEYFTRVTDRQSYAYRDVIVWEDGKYVVKDSLTERKVTEMLKHMEVDEAEQFKLFLAEYWGEVA